MPPTTSHGSGTHPQRVRPGSDRARVFVGVDGSGASLSALHWALHNSARWHTELVVVHVVDGEWGMLGPRYAGEATRQGAAVVAEALRHCRGAWPGPVSSRMLHGSMVQELTALPEERDLLVIGSHKTGYFRGQALGSRSVHVLAAARSSVIVIPNVPVNRGRDVVVGVDGSAWSNLAVAYAAREAARRGGPLILMHARRVLPDLWQTPELPEDLQTAQAVVRRAAAIAHSTAPEVELSSRIVHQPASLALLRVAASGSLLVLGADSPPGGGGSVTHDVAMNLSVPLLVVRGSDGNGEGTKDPSGPVPGSEEW